MTNLRNAERYNIGLDMGTGSVGWAVTDQDGNLYRFKGKPTWGSRLFTSAESAATARTYRGQRRRYDRRRQRLNLLQQMFQPEMEKTDSDFFVRLNQSRLWKDDPQRFGEYTWPLFNKKHPLIIDGKEITEPVYYGMFPTIYHLRFWLMQQTNQVDIRLIYLAFHNIVKTRGNFLYQDMGTALTAKNADISKSIDEFAAAFEDWQGSLDEESPLKGAVVDADVLEAALNDTQTRRAEKEEVAAKAFSTDSSDKKKMGKAFADAFIGYKANLTYIFDIKEDNKDIKLSFGDEEKVDAAKELLGDEDKLLFEAMNAIYSSVVLQDILHITNAEVYWASGIFKTALEGMDIDDCAVNISKSKIIEYGRYREDLKCLKQLVKKYYPNDGETGKNSSEYKTFFKGKEFCDPKSKVPVKGHKHRHMKYDPATAEGYTRYDLGAKGGTDIRTKSDVTPYEQFKKDTLSLFRVKYANGKLQPLDESVIALKAAADESILEIAKRFEDQTFMRKLKTSDNGVIPYQLHLEEMTAIIEGQKASYPFLAEVYTTHDGVVRNKIKSLVSFRIPYYVGPLTQKSAAKDVEGRNRFAWSVRQAGKESAKVYPWNWDDVIDKETSADAFMHRMIGSDTYLWNEPVLPRCSLLYEKYCVLNELNGAHYKDTDGNIRRLDVSERKQIFEDLFIHGKHVSVSYRDVEDWAKRHCRRYAELSGGQEENGFESKLGSYRYFCRLLGTTDLNDSQREMAEDIIEWNTLFEDRDILRAKIKETYSNFLSDKQIKDVCKKRFTGWGNLSKKLLTGIKVKSDEGPVSVMDVLEYGYPNAGCSAFRHGDAMVLMQVLHNETLDFEEKINEINEESGEGRLLTVDDLPYASPALRRSINQTMRIVEEIVSIAGCAPENIYIESTRDEDELTKKGRTKKRFESLNAQLKSLNGEQLKAGIMNELKENESKLDSDRLMLYFMQNGKSMYSGADLDIRNLSSYQIDHIIPQSYIKDDSLDNRVLVKADENQRKKDSLLLDESIRTRMKPVWNALHNAHLMSDKKYSNLCCDSISERRMQGFINRQLVETSQVVKFAAQILAQRYPQNSDGTGTRVCTVKAGISHQLRQVWDNVAGRYVWRFPKVREMNDYHHAHDAYLAAEVGRFISIRYPESYTNPVGMAKAMRTYIKRRANQYAIDHKAPGHSFIAASFLESGFDKETGVVTRDKWDAEAELARMTKYFNLPDCYITRMPEITAGAFSNATLYSPRNQTMAKKLDLSPQKKNLSIQRYGGFSSENPAFFFIFEKEDKKGNKVFSFAALPVSKEKKICIEGRTALEEYAKTLLKSGEKFVCIIKPMLYKYQLIEIDGCRMLLTGKKDASNACELAFDINHAKTIAKIVEGGSPDKVAMLDLYDECTAKLQKYMHEFAKNLKLESYRSSFESACVETQSQIILSILDLVRVSSKANTVNLSGIGGKKSAGRYQPTYNSILKSRQFAIIDQSITGMFENRTELKHSEA